MRRHSRAVTTGLLVLLLSSGCAAEPPVEDRIRIGAGPEAEGQLLARVAEALLRDADFAVEVELFASAASAREALELGRVDLTPGYTGATWLEVHGRADPSGSARTSWEEVAELDERRGLRWLRPPFEREEVPADLPANATFAFVVQPESGLETMSQLATRLGEEPGALVCVDAEFGRRPDGLQAVLDAYRVSYDREFVAADAGEAVAGVAAGDCLAGLTTATDGRSWEAGLVPLTDDLEIFPAFVVSLVVREDAADQHPGLVAAVAPLIDQLTTTL
ncbi:MAG: glycine betaine ABC transporter substrate-binding protein, partial [Nitriliruptorales bacterium]|nr:glycine betaine ABC transporter substrate-binding protein [Nitriliruptorales bacterium]